jgi:hypothetical protein
MYVDDLDRRRLCEDDLCVLREIAKTPSGRRSIRRAIVRLNVRIVWLRMRRVFLELWNAPRVALEARKRMRASSSLRRSCCTL